MTEERRIFSKNGVKLAAGYDEDEIYDDCDCDILEFTTAVNREATPITKENLKVFVKYRVDDYDEIGALIKLIGIDEFWNKYGKPVLEEKYFVYVPHTNCETYCKNDLGLAVVSDDTDLDNCEFTEAEIKKYHLEDCKREVVDD